MGTMTLEPGELENIINETKEAFSDKKIDVWEILYSQIIRPVKQIGYVDVNVYFDGSVTVGEVKKALLSMESLIHDFDGKKYGISKTPVIYISSIIADINGFFREKGIVAPLTEYEEFAVAFLVFWAGNRDYKKALLEELLKHYHVDKQYVLEKNVRVLYDSASVDLHVISTIEDYTRHLESILGGNGGKRGKIYFRGHGNVSYKLLPSLFRERKHFKNEQKMYEALMVNCPQEFVSLHSHIDILSEMQHYGLPTRLLDVTSNALTALYFTCEKNSPKIGEVVMLEISPERTRFYHDAVSIMLASLPRLSYEEQQRIFEHFGKGLKSTKSEKAVEKLKAEVRSESCYATMWDVLPLVTEYYMVLPQKLNRRIMNQDGAFILCGLFDDIYEPDPFQVKKTANVLENLRVKVNEKKAVMIIKNKGEIMRCLNSYGINKIRVYPEIEKVSEYIRENIEDM